MKKYLHIQKAMIAVMMLMKKHLHIRKNEDVKEDDEEYLDEAKKIRKLYVLHVMTVATATQQNRQKNNQNRLRNNRRLFFAVNIASKTYSSSVVKKLQKI